MINNNYHFYNVGPLVIKAAAGASYAAVAKCALVLSLFISPVTHSNSSYKHQKPWLELFAPTWLSFGGPTLCPFVNDLPYENTLIFHRAIWGYQRVYITSWDISLTICLGSWWNRAHNGNPMGEIGHETRMNPFDRQCGVSYPVINKHDYGKSTFSMVKFTIHGHVQ